MKRLIISLLLVFVSSLLFAQNKVKFFSDDVNFKVFINDKPLSENFDTVAIFLEPQKGIYVVKIVSDDSLVWNNGIYFEENELFKVEKNSDTLVLLRHTKNGFKVVTATDMVDKISNLGVKIDKMAKDLFGSISANCSYPNNDDFLKFYFLAKNISDDNTRLNFVKSYIGGKCFYSLQVYFLLLLFDNSDFQYSILELVNENVKDRENLIIVLDFFADDKVYLEKVNNLIFKD